MEKTSVKITILVAIIGAAATIIAAVIGSSDGKDGEDPDKSDPKTASSKIEIPADSREVKTEVDVAIDGKHEGYIYTHESPHSLTINTTPGKHNYSLHANSYAAGRPEQVIKGEGSGDILIEDGKVYSVLGKPDTDNTPIMFLQEMD